MAWGDVRDVHGAHAACVRAARLPALHRGVRTRLHAVLRRPRHPTGTVPHMPPASQLSSRTSPRPSVCVQGVTRRLGNHLVLDHASLAVDGAGVIGVAGANGAGKTTLLRVIAQLLAPDAGDVAVCGFATDGDEAARARACVGWVPHHPIARPGRTIAANLLHASALQNMSRPLARASVARVIAEWSLESVQDRHPDQLSRGQLQRYSMARSDIARPPVLLLDEPTSALDSAARQRLDAALEQWAAERLVVVSSHEHAWLSQHARLMLRLDSGKVHVE